MREVVGTNVDVEVAQQLGRDFVYDPELRAEILAEHVWAAFDSYCRSLGFVKPDAFEDANGQFDTRSYVDYNVRRRDMLNAFILTKPKIVAVRSRFFTFEFVSEIEVAIHELSSTEVANALNQLLRPRKLTESLREWWRCLVKARRRSKFVNAARGARSNST